MASVSPLFSIVLFIVLCIAIPTPPNLHIPCTDGATIIISRGTAEHGLGRLKPLAEQIQNRVPHSTITANPYPASFTLYEASEEAGVTLLTKMIEEHVDQCPKSQIVLLGWSQGAQVSMDTICGTSELTFLPTKPLAEKYRHNIRAVIVYGDVSHVPKRSWDRGNSTHGGVFPRQNSKLCDPFADKLRSWCHEGDPICSEGTHLEQHFTYFDQYDEDAARFAVDLLD